jgi:hypothetical protein
LALIFHSSQTTRQVCLLDPNNNLFIYLFIYVLTQQPKGQLQSKHEPKNETKKKNIHVQWNNTTRQFESFKAILLVQSCKYMWWKKYNFALNITSILIIKNVPLWNTIKWNNFSFTYVSVITNISSWSAYSRRTIVTWRAQSIY